MPSSVLTRGREIPIKHGGLICNMNEDDLKLKHFSLPCLITGDHSTKAWISLGISDLITPGVTGPGRILWKR